MGSTPRCAAVAAAGPSGEGRPCDLPVGHRCPVKKLFISPNGRKNMALEVPPTKFCRLPNF